MKRLLVLCFLVGGLAWADDSQTWLNIGEIQISSTGVMNKTTQPSMITFSNPIYGGRNCVTRIGVSADQFPAVGYTFTVLDGGTTVYQLSAATGPIVHQWDYQNPLILSPGATTYVYVSTGNFKVNMTGYQRNR